MTIWIKSTDRMPRNDDTLIIIKSEGVVSGQFLACDVHNLKNQYSMVFEWAVYSQELWIDISK